MKVVSFDQATYISGYAVIEDGEYKKSGTVNSRKNESMDERLIAMTKGLCKIIADEDADCVVIEDVQQQVNKQTFKHLARLQGAILGYCGVNDIPCLVYPATTWRRRLGFSQGQGVKRQGLKSQAIEYVKDNCKKNVKNDEADAICIGLAAFADDKDNTH